MGIVFLRIDQAGVVGMLMQDFGVVKLVRAVFPDLGVSEYRDTVTVATGQQTPIGLASWWPALSHRLEHIEEWMK